MNISIQDITGVNEYAVIRDSNDNVWNGTAFETYNAAHWTTYALAATEQSPTGFYYVTVPAGITAGNYDYVFYRRAGGSPATTDSPTGAGTFTVATVAATGLAALIQSLRTLCHDTPYKTVYAENLGVDPASPIDGVNTTFKLNNQNIAAGSVYVSIVGVSYRTQVGFAVLDAANGVIVFTSAPASGQTVQVDYSYQWYTDADYTEWLNEACQSTFAGTTNPTLIIAALVPVMLQYALSLFYKRRAAQYAEKYASSGEGAAEQIQSVAEAFRRLADQADKRADSLQDRYYKRQGQQNAPAYGVATTIIDPITPIR